MYRCLLWFRVSGIHLILQFPLHRFQCVIHGIQIRFPSPLGKLHLIVALLCCFLVELVFDVVELASSFSNPHVAAISIGNFLAGSAKKYATLAATA